MTPLKQSPYSFHFNNLIYLGAWVLSTKNQKLIKYYALLRTVIICCQIYGLFGFLSNLVLVFGDLKKMSWNLSVTTIYTVFMVKTVLLCHKHSSLNNLRSRLHRDAEVRQQLGEPVFNNLALKEMKLLRVIFYITIITFLPIWIFSKYFVHHDLPVPFEVPYFLDLNNKLNYIFAFFVLGFTSTITLTSMAETQLAMFGLLIQISREYQVLVNDIPQLDDLYSEPHSDKVEGKVGKKEWKLEVNPWLRKAKTKMLLKKFSNRLQQIIGYTQAFEFCYSSSFLMEVFAATVIIITLAFQALFRPLDLSGDFLFQTGYMGIVVVDMFTLCLYVTKVRDQCFEVGAAAYSTKWYTMSTDIQKDISFFIMRSQNPPKITAAKLMPMNLSVLMHRMGNIFSALALLRQLEFQKNSR